MKCHEQSETWKDHLKYLNNDPNLKRREKEKLTVFQMSIYCSNLWIGTDTHNGAAQNAF